MLKLCYCTLIGLFLGIVRFEVFVWWVCCSFVKRKCVHTVAHHSIHILAGLRVEVLRTTGSREKNPKIEIFNTKRVQVETCRNKPAGVAFSWEK